MHPHFPELIGAFKEEPEAYINFIAIVCYFFFGILHLYAHILILGFFFQLVRAMGEARAQDTNILRYEVPKFIPLNYKTDSVMPPITGGEKSGRGFSHPATGRLLCPLRYLDRFDFDPM